MVSSLDDETYAVGDPLDAGVDFGLLLPVRCADTFGVAEAEGRCAGGVLEDGAGATMST